MDSTAIGSRPKEMLSRIWVPILKERSGETARILGLMLIELRFFGQALRVVSSECIFTKPV